MNRNVKVGSKTSPTIAVIGLGYVGLPLAIAASKAGANVLGIDKSEKVVAALLSGKSSTEDVPQDSLEEELARGLSITNDFAATKRATVVVICVPTPLQEGSTPDLSYVIDAVTEVARYLQPGALVVLESTSFPGTTDEVVQPILSGKGKRKIDEDFFLAFSPERIDPGNAHFSVHNTPKLVGGVSESSGRIAFDFYQTFLPEVVLLKSAKEAEMAKLLENTYRQVNIALANEMAKVCNELEIDVWEVIRGASTKPFGFQAFFPGPGVGGHCIPIDPQYLDSDVRRRLGYGVRFIELAKEINDGMPSYVVQRVQAFMNDRGKALEGLKVLLLGVSYKKNLSDTRESPALKIADLLLAQGCDLSYHDPRVETFETAGGEIPRVESLLDGANEADLVIVLQAHDEYLSRNFEGVQAPFFDTSGSITAPNVHRL